MESDVSGSHGNIEVMSTLRVFVHVAPEELGLKLVDILVREPHGGVVRVRHGVRGDMATPVTLTLGHQSGYLGRGTQIKLNPLVACNFWTFHK